MRRCANGSTPSTCASCWARARATLPRRPEGAAAIVARIEDGKWNTLEGDGDHAKPSLDGIRAAHRFGAVVDPSGVRGGPELLKALARMMPPAANR